MTILETRNNLRHHPDKSKCSRESPQDSKKTNTYTVSNATSNYIKLLSGRKNHLVKLITLKVIIFPVVKVNSLHVKKRNGLLLMAQPASSLIPGMCHFVFLRAFVRPQRVSCHEVTNEGIDSRARTSIPAFRC